jgi:primosomal protein N''
MALVKQNLKTEIKNMLNDLKNETDQAVAIEMFAERLATIIDNYIRSATVTTTVTGTDATGTPVTGTGTGTLS